MSELDSASSKTHEHKQFHTIPTNLAKFWAKKGQIWENPYFRGRTKQKIMSESDSASSKTYIGHHNSAEHP